MTPRHTREFVTKKSLSTENAKLNAQVRQMKRILSQVMDMCAAAIIGKNLAEVTGYGDVMSSVKQTALLNEGRKKSIQGVKK